MEFYNDLQYNICEECILSIAYKKDIKLPNIYQCEVCKRKFKTTIKLALDLGTVVLQLYVKSVTQSGKMKINSRNTWNRNITYKNGFGSG